MGDHIDKIDINDYMRPSPAFSGRSWADVAPEVAPPSAALEADQATSVYDAIAIAEDQISRFITEVDVATHLVSADVTTLLHRPALILARHLSAKQLGAVVQAHNTLADMKDLIAKLKDQLSILHGETT